MDNLDLFIESNRKFLVDGWQSMAKRNGVGWVAETSTIKDGTGGKQTNEKTFLIVPSRILSASPHLQGYDSPAELIDELLSRGYSLFEILEMIENSGD